MVADRQRAELATQPVYGPCTSSLRSVALGDGIKREPSGLPRAGELLIEKVSLSRRGINMVIAHPASHCGLGIVEARRARSIHNGHRLPVGIGLRGRRRVPAQTGVASNNTYSCGCSRAVWSGVIRGRILKLSAVATKLPRCANRDRRR